MKRDATAVGLDLALGLDLDDRDRCRLVSTNIAYGPLRIQDRNRTRNAALVRFGGDRIIGGINGGAIGQEFHGFCWTTIVGEGTNFGVGSLLAISLKTGI